MKKHSEVIASGIDELVAKLRKEGVEAAEQESERIITEAKQQAQKIVAEAKTVSEQELARVQEQIKLEQQAARDALQIAYRDLVLEIKTHLLNRFSDDVERLVRSTAQDSDVLEKLVLAATGRIMKEADVKPDAALEITLPEHALELEEITRDPQSASTGPLADFVFLKAPF